MLAKMIRYDLRFGSRKYALMAAMTAALLLMAAFGRLVNNNIIMGLGIFFAILASVAYLVLYVVISIQHLYSQLCGRESYLSYSLPVSVHTLLLSKLICILFWAIVTFLLLAVFWLVGVELIFLRPEGGSSVRSIREALDSLSSVERAEILSMFPVTAATIVVGIFQQVAQFAFCVSLVNVPALKERNLGVAAGILVYLFGSQAIGMVEFGALWGFERIRWGNNAFWNMDTPAATIPFLMYFLVCGVILTVGYYAAAAYLIGRKRSI